MDALLDFAGLGPPVITEVSLPQVIDRVLGLLRPRFREGHHTVTHVVDPRTPWITGNALTIEQILVNPVLNSVEAAEGTHIHLRVEPAFEQQGKFVRVVVEDDGQGATDTEGGFGLVGIRERAEQLGGRVSYRTAPGAGFAMQMELPG